MFWIFAIFPSLTEENFVNNEQDPDVNICNDVVTLDTQYLARNKF